MPGFYRHARWLVVIYLLGIKLSLASGLETGETSKISRPTPPPENSILTDPKLRAEEGSMSRYSVRFNLSYYGPTLGDLPAKEQPNPDGGVGSYSTSLGGSISARHRFTKTRALNLGTGIKAIHPLHGISRFDINNPYLELDFSSRSGALQMRSSPGINYITVPYFKEIGEYGGLTFNNSLVYDWSSSNLGIGLETSLGYYLYDRPYQKSDGRASSYTLSIIPNFKYRLSDRMNIYTSIAFNYWNPRSEGNPTILWPRTASQRLGVGYAWTKEIYLAPYLNFFPDRLSADSVTFNMSTIFSVL